MKYLSLSPLITSHIPAVMNQEIFLIVIITSSEMNASIT